MSICILSIKRTEWLALLRCTKGAPALVRGSRSGRVVHRRRPGCFTHIAAGAFSALPSQTKTGKGQKEHRPAAEADPIPRDTIWRYSLVRTTVSGKFSYCVRRSGECASSHRSRQTASTRTCGAQNQGHLHAMPRYGAEIPDADRSAILDYLIKNFGPASGATKPPAKKSPSAAN